jgi:hypothetical protein
VPVFDGPLGYLEQAVEVAIDVDVGTAKLVLIPLPGDVERAIVRAEQEIVKSLKAELKTVPVYYGKP